MMYMLAERFETAAQIAANAMWAARKGKEGSSDAAR
jgi:hypothetical protein